MKINSIQELNEAIRNNTYQVEYVKPKYFKENAVIDEDKSVKWNREEVQRLNEEMKAKVEQNRKERRAMESKQIDDIVRVYANDSGYTEEQIGKIFNYAYSESHSSGIFEVLQTLDDLVDLMKDVDIK